MAHKHYTNYRVNITLDDGKTRSVRVLAVNKEEAIKKVYDYNYMLQKDISKYKAEEPVLSFN